MKINYEPKSEMFSAGKVLCFKRLELWKNEAMNLFYSALVLYEFEGVKTTNIFDTSKNALDPLFSTDIVNENYFNYRVQRMLWAYGFENILKALILCKIKISDSSIHEVPLQKIKNHNLVELAKNAEINLTYDEEFYLKILEKCSLWAGRYPLPIKSEQMYLKREPLSSSDELVKRTQSLLKCYISGKIPRTTSESDIIHSGIGSVEIFIYQSLKDRLIKIFDNLNRLNDNKIGDSDR